MRPKAFAGTLILALLSLIGVSAEEGGSYSLLSFSFLPLPFLEGNGGPGVETSASINMLAGERAELTGAELGIALNLERGSVQGAQFGGLGNIVQGSVSGAQFSFCANIAGGPLRGVQLGGLYNRASSVSGLQFGFALNQTAGELRGLKLGGRRSYTILLVSTPPSQPGRWCIDCGWGLRLSAPAFRTDLDLSWRTEETASFTAGKEERLRGSALLRGQIKPRGLPLALGISGELLIPGVSSEEDGSLAASPRLRPALYLDLGPL